LVAATKRYIEMSENSNLIYHTYCAEGADGGAGEDSNTFGSRVPNRELNTAPKPKGTTRNTNNPINIQLNTINTKEPVIS